MRKKLIFGCDNLDMEQSTNNDLIFLGSSRCYDHFDPALFEKGLGLRAAANLGIDGHSDLAMIKLRLLNYLEKNKASRIAILNFDPFISVGSVTDNTNMVYKNQFARFAFLPSAANRPIVDYFKFNVLEKYVPLYAVLKYRLLPGCVTLTRNSEWRAARYNRSDEEWDTVKAPVHASDELMQHYFDTGAVAMRNIERELGAVDSICLAHGTRLVCVQSPVYRSIYRSAVYAWPGKICSRLNIPFFDVNNEQLDDDMSLFFNANHMNTKGVARMTTQLLSDKAFRRLFGFP